jgi:hypothetical protein
LTVSSDELPFDLAGCLVVQVSWPPRGFQLFLCGQTAGGEPVEGARLTFEAVANLQVLKSFLREKRFLDRRGLLGGGWCRDNRSRNYPLRVPAELTHLAAGKAKRVRYDDPALEDYADHSPASLLPGRKLYLFALAEKRFKGRKPFPVICERVTLAGATGGALAGAVSPPSREWRTEDFEELGMRYLVATITGDLGAAYGLLSRECQKRLGKAAFARQVAKEFRNLGWTPAPGHGGVAAIVRRLEKALGRTGPGKPDARLRNFLYAAAADDDEIVWESVQDRRPAGFPREAVRAYVHLGAEFYRGLFSVDVVEEDGELRIDLG